MNINIILSNKNKKEENLLELYSKLEYDKTKIKNIMGKKQHYFVIISVIFMIMMLFSIIFIITTVFMQYKNNQIKNLIYKNKFLKN
jgi:hypothetical protein